MRSRLNSSFFSASVFCLLLDDALLNKFLMRPSKDKIGAAADFSATIGAGAAGVMPRTAATGLTSLAVSSAVGM